MSFARALRDGGPAPVDRRGVYLVDVIMGGVLRSAELGDEVEVETGYRPVGRVVT